ncbi:MAG: CHAD domain-containing protein [Phycicoccus sp.]|nr:CHAD domain-containing protein [Phycicoccus sp.]NMM32477.1 CHAD domain-containing protein [Phycicoccus sp.]
MTKSTATGVRSTRRLLLTYVSAQIDDLRSHEPGARIGSPNAVHRMRVASRRLRSSLGTFRPLFRGSKPQRLRDELQWLGTVLGPVRDVEVIRAHLQEAAATHAGDANLATVLAQLDHELAERHSRAHAEQVIAMDGPRYAALLAALEAFVIRPPWARRTTKASARQTLPVLVGRACARVDRAARAAQSSREADGMPERHDAELHEVRKAAKRARYAAEVAGSSAGPAAHALAERMEELQAVLGGHQDSLMVQALIRDLAGRMTKRQALALDLLAGSEQGADESFLAAYDQALAAASADEVRGWTGAKRLPELR